MVTKRCTAASDWTFLTLETFWRPLGDGRRYNMKGTNLDELLNRITRLYIELIPTALKSVPSGLKLYGGFIPYCGWEAEPEDHAEHGRTIYILDTAYLKTLQGETDDIDEVSRRAYGWGEFIGGESVMIESTELNDALLEWYSFQNEHDESTELLDQIGTAIASACLVLNERGWSQQAYTDDFVVFTDCTADEEYNVGLRAGMFRWLSP
jgi:hypothetical protein